MCWLLLYISISIELYIKVALTYERRTQHTHTMRRLSGHQMMTNKMNAFVQHCIRLPTSNYSINKVARWVLLYVDINKMQKIAHLCMQSPVVHICICMQSDFLKPNENVTSSIVRKLIIIR